MKLISLDSSYQDVLNGSNFISLGLIDVKIFDIRDMKLLPFDMPRWDESNDTSYDH